MSLGIINYLKCPAVCLPLLWCSFSVVAGDANADGANAAAHEPQSHGDDERYSKAQLLLFGTPHLKNIVAKSQLHYDVVQSGSLGHEITGQIVLSITAIDENGGKNIQPQFLGGRHEKKFAPVEGFQGNALLLYFLEWDAEKMHVSRAMNRHRIHRQHFQRVMRHAFSTDATIEPGTFSLNGAKFRARSVHMRPLSFGKNDPKYAHMWNKEYTFVLATDIPGMIYRITTEIPGDRPGASPKERTEITFARVVPVDAYRESTF